MIRAGPFAFLTGVGLHVLQGCGGSASESEEKTAAAEAPAEGYDGARPYYESGGGSGGSYYYSSGGGSYYEAPASNTTGPGGCICVGFPADLRANTTALKGYAPTFGEVCAPHDAAYGDCLKDDPPSWCAASWCYVEKSCPLDDVTESFYFPGEGGIFYSYANCGAEDEFSAEAFFTR
jgi:hypothetical protein